MYPLAYPGFDMNRVRFLAVSISDIAKKGRRREDHRHACVEPQTLQDRISKETRSVFSLREGVNYQLLFAAPALSRARRVPSAFWSTRSTTISTRLFQISHDVCYKKRVFQLFTTSEFDLDRERRILESFLNRFADGLVITRTADQNVDLLQKISDMGIRSYRRRMGPTSFPW
jgi:hypothetical protein